MRDTFLFDLDGTLVTMELDFVQIRKDIDAIVAKSGYPRKCLDEKKSTLEIIKSAVEYVRTHGLDWKALKKEAETYLEEAETEAASKAVLIEGAKPVLKLLKEKKKKVGLITRNNRKVAVKVLKKCGLYQYVDILLARDDVGKVKPHPDHVLEAVQKLHSSPDKTVVLGDHHYEITAGNEAGCFTVAFLTGSGNRETLKEADLILDSINDLREILLTVEQ